MPQTNRRSLLTFLFAVMPCRLVAQAVQKTMDTADLRVLAGEDRFGKIRPIPTGTSVFKVATADTGGALFAMEHTNVKKGGPPRHLHHEQDEWFYVLEGEYLIEVGGKQYRLKAGDSVLGPREIPHAWAFVGTTPGRLLISYAPAGKIWKPSSWSATSVEASHTPQTPKPTALQAWSSPDLRWRSRHSERQPIKGNEPRKLKTGGMYLIQFPIQK